MEILSDESCRRAIPVPARMHTRKVSDELEQSIRLNGTLLERLAKAKSDRARELDLADQITRWNAELQAALSYSKRHAPVSLLSVDSLVDGSALPGFVKPGDISAIDHYIYLHGGTTSTYEERPQVIAEFKNTRRESERELLREMAQYRHVYETELEYHHRISAVEKVFQDVVLQAKADIENSARRIQNIVETREQGRRIAARVMMRDLGLVSFAGDIEQWEF